MIRMQHLRPLAAAVSMSLSLLLAACGGGGDGSGDAAGPGGAPSGGAANPPPAAGPVLVASSGTAAGALVQWQGAPGSGPWTLERLRDGDAMPVGLDSVAEADGARFDSGLAAGAAYRYRLRDAAGAVVVEGTVTTGSEEALAVALGDAQAAAETQPLGPQAGELGRGAVSLRYEAGSFAAAGSATLTPHVNPLADGVGDAWAIALDQRPRRALTVAIAYGADEDPDEVDNQRLAVRQADGSWWMLTAFTHDRAARRLSAVLPSALVPASVPAGDAAAAPSSLRARAAAAGVPTRVEIQLVRFVGVKLVPRTASVRVLGSLHLQPVAIWDVREDACDVHPDALCVPGIGLVRRELPIVNSKPGYTRGWQLEGSGSPDPALGTLSPGADAGATYRAPAAVPSVNPVTVRFESRHAASSRRMAVTARVRVTEDAWVGPMTLSHSTDGIGYYYDADTRWVLDAARSTESVRVYRAQGPVTLHINSGACPLTPSPASAQLGPLVGFSELEVDEITGRYRVQLNARWPTTLSTCLGTPMPTVVGVTFDQSGAFGGERIQGSQQDGPTNRVWNLGRP